MNNHDTNIMNYYHTNIMNYYHNINIMNYHHNIMKYHHNHDHKVNHIRQLVFKRLSYNNAAEDFKLINIWHIMM